MRNELNWPRDDLGNPVDVATSTAEQLLRPMTDAEWEAYPYKANPEAIRKVLDEPGFRTAGWPRWPRML